MGFFCALAILPSYGIAARVKRGRRNDTRVIQQLEEQWREGLLKKDVSKMGPMMADDFMGISANGTLSDKPQYLHHISSGRYTFTKIDVDESKVRIHEDTAIVLSHADIAATLDGTVLQGEYRYTRVYRRVPTGNWKLINFEATRISGNGDSDMHRGVPMK